MLTGDLPVSDHTDQGIRLLEEERRRIARDLHDGPAQSITNVSMRLDAITRLIKPNPDMAQQELKRLNSRVVAIVNDIRRLIYDLRPVAVDEVGIVSAVSELCRKSSDSWGIPIDVDVDEEVSLGIAPAKQVAIYRLVQEILNNVKKHADANRVEVLFRRDEQNIVITIEDDGKGFDPTVIPTGHFGIIGMKERAAYLDGILDIESEISRGSKFTIAVPVYNIQ